MTCYFCGDYWVCDGEPGNCEETKQVFINTEPDNCVRLLCYGLYYAICTTDGCCPTLRDKPDTVSGELNKGALLLESGHYALWCVSRDDTCEIFIRRVDDCDGIDGCD